MKVKVQIRQADLPGGLAYWMSIFNNATSVNQIQIPSEQEEVSEQTGGESSEPQVD